MPLLKVENLSVSYGDKDIVKKCSFTLNAGEIVVVLGASGDGKTTMLKTIAGQLERKKGAIYFQDIPVADPTEQLVPGHPHIKLVNQDFNLDEFHSVEENIRLRLLSFDKEYQQQRIKSLLRLTRLTPYRAKKATEISGGQRQRLAIARALADEPDLVLLDEPFNQLDFQTKNKIATHIKSYLKKNNIGAIMVTHNGVEAMEWADRILFMRNGKIVRDDTPNAFFNQPNSIEEARFFGEINKVQIADEYVYFRPSFYATKKEQEYNLKIPLIFEKVVQLGWYGAYYYKSGNTKVVLYSTTDISHLESVFIRRILIK
ncbi:MAG: ATP-binding cassette domain-containing protein [Crocinitomix sp.]|nr:ATP-binding cassette domain-containing protein [Crocinitomix sp.]